jgi:methanogenic corrinoid protein MtbC1
MAEQLAPPTDAQIVQDKFIQEALEALREHNLARLSKHLKRAFYLQGLPSFLRQSLHPLVVAIGESWKRGDIRIFEEHLFSQVTCDLLHEAIGTVANHAGSPRVLLATPPKELHTLGLLMANIELSLQGACCLGLGAQTPEAEIAEAVGACGIDIVGLGFSAAFSKREAARFASGLRHQLESAIEIWVGGQGAAHLSQIAGVSHIRDLDELDCAILAWRERHR